MDEAKKTRDGEKDSIRVAAVLASYAQSAKKLKAQLNAKLEDMKSLIQSLYGSSKYLFQNFVDVHTQPTFETFPRLVVFYLPRADSLNVNVIPGETRILDAIPGKSYYYKVDSLIPENQNIREVLDRSYDLLRPVLENPALPDEMVPCSSVSEFSARSEYTCSVVSNVSFLSGCI